MGNYGDTPTQDSEPARLFLSLENSEIHRSLKNTGWQAAAQPSHEAAGRYLGRRDASQPPRPPLGPSSVDGPPPLTPALLSLTAAVVLTQFWWKLPSVAELKKLPWVGEPRGCSPS